MTDLDIARNRLVREGLRLVAIRDGEVLFLSRAQGVGELVELLEREPEALDGAFAADAVTGRASALLMLYGSLRGLYSPVISQEALRLLEQSAVHVEYDRMVDYIRKRDGEGRCPLEELTRGIDSPAEAFEALRAFTASRAHTQGGTV